MAISLPRFVAQRGTAQAPHRLELRRVDS